MPGAGVMSTALVDRAKLTRSLLQVRHRLCWIDRVHGKERRCPGQLPCSQRPP
ncbi:hypothetical protein [Ornithinimicrobium kibberense]|uniref:hypothetical protein n=1 Tax=Ornithinimicrobium kibberense TaxID=282060 RepID=UPI00360815E6